MSVELIGTSVASHMLLPDLPALIGPKTGEQADSGSVDPGYLCLISQVEGQLVVWVLGAKGGTLVNGSRVSRATLKNSDTLVLGGNEYRVHSDQSPKRYVYGPRN